jgi:hypothetical protein
VSVIELGSGRFVFPGRDPVSVARRRRRDQRRTARSVTFTVVLSGNGERQIGLFTKSMTTGRDMRDRLQVSLLDLRQSRMRLSSALLTPRCSFCSHKQFKRVATPKSVRMPVGVSALLLNNVHIHIN